MAVCGRYLKAACSSFPKRIKRQVVVRDDGARVNKTHNKSVCNHFGIITTDHHNFDLLLGKLCHHNGALLHGAGGRGLLLFTNWGLAVLLVSRFIHKNEPKIRERERAYAKYIYARRLLCQIRTRLFDHPRPFLFVFLFKCVGWCLRCSRISCIRVLPEWPNWPKSQNFCIYANI